MHYATIEDASSLLSRSLEKRLIKLLQIPKDDNALKAAITEREGFFYKLYNFFNAGRTIIKYYRDKAADPVNQVIWNNLSPALKSQIKDMRGEIKLLDQQDRLETALIGKSSLSEEQFAGISDKIAQTIKP